MAPLLVKRPQRFVRNNAEQGPSANGGIAPISRAQAAFLHIIDTSRLLAVLREDNRAIIRAASAASKAADYLLAFRGDAPAPAAIEEKAAA